MHLIVENQSTDPVAILLCDPGQQSSAACRVHRFKRTDGGEKHRRPIVQPDQHRSFAFVPIELGMGGATTGGHPPVDTANIIAGLITTGLFVFHTATTKTRQVTATSG